MRPKKIVLKDPMDLYKIVARVNRDGLESVAKNMGVDKSTLSRFLARQNYVVTNVWQLTAGGKVALENANE